MKAPVSENTGYYTSQSADCSGRKSLFANTTKMSTTSTVNLDASTISEFYEDSTRSRINILSEEELIESPTYPKKKKKLMLDLDGTLVAIFKAPPKVQHSIITVGKGDNKGTLYVAPRKGLIRFLQTLDEHFEIELFTSVRKETAETILREFDADFYISKIFHREHCFKFSGGAYLKVLSSISVDTSTCVFIDDNQINAAAQPLNFLAIEPFFGQEGDSVLIRLIPFLIWLSKKPDVRPVCDFYSEYSTSPTKKITAENTSAFSSSDTESDAGELTERRMDQPAVYFTKPEQHNTSTRKMESSKSKGISVLCDFSKQFIRTAAC